MLKFAMKNPKGVKRKVKVEIDFFSRARFCLLMSLNARKCTENQIVGSTTLRTTVLSNFMFENGS